MKIRSFILIFIISLLLSGCGIGAKSYEVFERNNNFQIGKSLIPKLNKENRQIYDENHYIYIYKHIPEKCIHGFLTNRDDKPEKVVDWKILSGKEYCKEQEQWILSF